MRSTTAGGRVLLIGSKFDRHRFQLMRPDLANRHTEDGPFKIKLTSSGVQLEDPGSGILVSSLIIILVKLKVHH